MKKKIDFKIIKKSKGKNLKFLVNQNTRAGNIVKISEGHFKIQGDSVEELFMGLSSKYGTAEELTFEYVFIENLLYKENLSRLQKMKKLRSINFSYNNLTNYLDLVKFENIQLHRLSVENNPVCSCGFLKYFVVYRFSSIKVFNGNLVRDKDMTAAKTIFSRFDKLLQRPVNLGSKKKGLSYKERARLAKNAGKALWVETKLANSIEKQFEGIWESLASDYLDQIISSS